jgi:peptide/nickel transport system permease protein
MHQAQTPRSFPSLIFQRGRQSILAIIAVFVIGFVLLNLAPGDPVTYILGDTSNPERAAELRERLGLNAPLHERFLTYVDSVLHGQLGYSYVYGRPVLSMILSRLPATLLLFTAQFTISAVLGITLGAIAAYRKGTRIDKGIIALTILWFSIPVFWSGQILLLVFGLRLDWFPVFGMTSTFTDLPPLLDVLWHLTLPTLALSLLFTPLVARLTRTSMAEALEEDYITTARAKGLGERAVVRQALRNAILPVVTILALYLGQLMAGAVLTETVFSWPGLGRLMFDAIDGHDYPIILGLFWFISIMVIVANLIADICYALLDPRVRYR